MRYAQESYEWCYGHGQTQRGQDDLSIRLLIHLLQLISIRNPKQRIVNMAFNIYWSLKKDGLLMSTNCSICYIVYNMTDNVADTLN